ncbi:Mth938-like domain-containing protein [Plasticicumulans sp.]|uniref:Mth938-like domain-containing protein n=1 Tax=Plasticicumulans sp. TaxID=2307179 RepID=UPI0011D74EF9|nr:Mth938-like domain-containing protein [Plasticicumulans sp.]MBS0602597.1 Mth938-like domain-containing protein [Pseudomonadota bacterium]TXI31478.1 MAG: hypothetical protein E6Q64_02985 [Ottowia sp.]HMV39659.1 Mth938-like domain-containing protein [Plasticicumulans sp.]HMW28709.1 Mth938-like domain-containing protein [Plasticicumulans sp.]HMW41513.1 Mth938-like domain-containing protein [Plasticicumulans sp.]
MRLALDQDSNVHLIRNYGPGYVTVDAEQRLTRSFALAPDALLPDWGPEGFEALAAEHFEALLALKPELVLLGTGARQRFPHPRLSRALTEAGIAVDAMDTAAACRTFNIVVAEGRRAVAALLMI